MKWIATVSSNSNDNSNNSYNISNISNSSSSSSSTNNNNNFGQLRNEVLLGHNTNGSFGSGPCKTTARDWVQQQLELIGAIGFDNEMDGDREQQ